jgi:uncharacterized protein
MHNKLPRKAEGVVLRDLQDFPVVAILGPRQCGKSTLAKMVGTKIPRFLYVDLERPSDLRKLDDPELFFDVNREMTVCLDEIQLKPELFPVLRSVVDTTGRSGQVMLLGSALQNLIGQGSESLAGRISFVELTPFLISEVAGLTRYTLFSHWFRGGYPDSLLAADDGRSNRWRENFIRTFVERDIPQLGARITAAKSRRFLTMCAHNQGQLLNSSKLGAALGVSYHTVRSYIDLFEQAYILRTLPPFEANLKKRIIKAPKIYVRDSGLLHALLEIPDFNALMSHPNFGVSWEGFCVENILAELDDWKGFFYRTSSGSEIDLILQKGTRRIAVEFKSSRSPVLTAGFWNALQDLDIGEAWVIAPVDAPYPMRPGVMVSGLYHFIGSVYTEASLSGDL